MIEALIYTNCAGEEVEFSTESEYYVNVSRDVSGLGDLETSLYTQMEYGGNGSVEVGFHTEERPIEISGHILSDEESEIAVIKRFLGHIFTPYRTGSLKHCTKSGMRTIDVRPTMAPKISWKQGECWPTFTINVIAHNPYWENITDTNDVVTGPTKDFKFPLRLPASGLTMEHHITNGLVVNAGDAPVGCRIDILFRLALSSIPTMVITNITTGVSMTIATMAVSVSFGDRLRINTAKGEKGLLLISAAGVETDYSYAIRAALVNFIELTLGSNELTLYVDGTTENSLGMTVIHSDLYAAG